MAAGKLHRKAPLLPYVLACLALGLAPSFVSHFTSRARQPRVSRADGATAIEKWGKDAKWQHSLDKALLDFDASIPEKLSGIRSVWDNRREVVKTLLGAAMLIREKGPSAQAEVLDTLFPKGTYARADIDSLINVANSVRRQVPDVAPELENLLMDLEKLSNKVGVPKELNLLAEEAAKRVLPIGVDTATGEAADVFREVQSDEREEVSYLVLKETRDYEIRVYQPYTLVKKKATEMTKAFADLASYLKKQKKNTQSMKVAMPVTIEYDVSPSRHIAKAMAFALESRADTTRADKDASISVTRVPMQYVAVRTVTSGTTDAELKELHSALQKDGTYAAIADKEYKVLQYYAPRAALWRRKTEVAIPVKPIKS